jgi:dihydrolipoamide dehydrogenase
MSNAIYDLMVIGGGPAGYAAAIAAGRLGKQVVLFEGEQLGGTCLNVGCIPSKYLLDKAALLEKIRTLSEQQIFRDAGSFSFSRIQKGKDAVVRKLTQGVGALLRSSKVTVVNGNAHMMAPGEVLCSGSTYQSTYTLIATGSKASAPPFPGAETLTIGSTEALSLQVVPKRLVVIGGGVIGLEMASAFRAFGSQVTVIEMLGGLLTEEDADAASELTHLLKARGIDIRTGATVSGVEQQAESKLVSFRDSNGVHQLSADVVLLATGRKANLAGIDCKALGIKLDPKGFIAVDPYLQTSVKRVYAAGDVAGGWQLAHSAYQEAEVAVENIFGQRLAIDESTMPRCVYTMPPFAAVGLTKRQADERDLKVVVGTFPFAASGMALAEDAAEGTVRVLVNEATDQVIGVQIVGHGAPEMIATATMAIVVGMTVNQWRRVITAHPSLGEALKEAVLDSRKLSLHTLQPKDLR